MSVEIKELEELIHVSDGDADDPEILEMATEELGEVSSKRQVVGTELLKALLKRHERETAAAAASASASGTAAAKPGGGGGGDEGAIVEVTTQS